MCWIAQKNVFTCVKLEHKNPFVMHFIYMAPFFALKVAS